MSTAGFDSEAATRSPADDRPGEPVSMDTAFMILKNSRRREVLRYLTEADGSATLDGLARHIAARENGIDEQALSSSQRKRVYIGLYQAHLPKMDDAGLIAFNKHRGQVELRPEAAQVVEYLNDAPAAASAPRTYLGSSLAVGAVAGAATVDLVAVPGLPLIVFAVATGIAAHCVWNRWGDGTLTSRARPIGDVDRSGRRRSEPR